MKLPFFTRLYFLLGLFSLAAGVIFYLCVRPETPDLLSDIFGRHQKIYAHGGWMFWLPSFIHGFGFTCLLSAVIGIRGRYLLACGVFWFAANLLYETVGGYTAIVPGRYGTYDTYDIVAAAVGCTLPYLLYQTLCFLMLYSNKNQVL